MKTQTREKTAWFLRKAVYIPALAVMWVCVLFVLVEVAPDYLLADISPPAQEETGGDFGEDSDKEGEFPLEADIKTFLLDEVIYFYLVYSKTGNTILAFLDFYWFFEEAAYEGLPMEEILGLIFLLVSVFCLANICTMVSTGKRARNKPETF